MKNWAILLFVVFCIPLVGLSQEMDNTKLGEILEDISKEVNGELGYWEVNYKGRQIIVITDEKNNRMRIICPIAERKQIKNKHMEEAMEANFDKALDVKYALYNDFMWSVFAHPFAELSEHQVEDAVSQVYVAAMTFGGAYVSTNLVFGGGQEEEK